MQDPIRKHFAYTQIWPLRPELGQILYAVSDFLYLIWFHSSKENLDHVQNQPGNQSRWPGQVLAKHICLEASWCAGIIRPGSGKMQLARYRVPTFRLCCVLPKTALIILCKTSQDQIWFWLTVSGLGQTDPLWKQASLQESLGPLLANTLAVSAFSPISLRSSNGVSVCVCVCGRYMCVCVCACVCGRNELEVCTMLAYLHISSFCTMLVLYTGHACTHLQILWGQRTKWILPTLPSWSRLDAVWIWHVYWQTTPVTSCCFNSRIPAPCSVTIY